MSQTPSTCGADAPPRLGAMLGFTDWAVEILSRADAAARRFNPDARVRLVRETSGSVRFELTDEASPGDETIEHPGGFTVLAEPGLEGTVDVVEPHDRLILRPPDDRERSVRPPT